MTRELVYLATAVGIFIIALSVADAIQRANKIEIATPKMVLRASELSPYITY